MEQIPGSQRTGVICEYFMKFDTNYTVPLLVYIPKNYNVTLKTTLLVYYKGGWLSRKEFPSDYAKEIIKDNPTFEYLDENNIIEIFPILESRLAIYGNYGYEHLQTQFMNNFDRSQLWVNKLVLKMP